MESAPHDKAIRHVPRVRIASPAEFARDHLEANRPVIIEGVLDGWPAMRAWTPASLAERLGDKQVWVSTSETGVFHEGEDGARSFSTEIQSFRRASEEIAADTGAGRRLYVMQQSIAAEVPELLEDIRVPAILGAERAAAILWFGGAGTVTSLHHDAVNNVYAQIYGKKRFTLFDPPQSDLLYPRPLTSASPHLSQVDAERPDLARHPRFREADPMVCDLGPGDLLFLPAFYWHHVRSLEPSISVSFWWAPRLGQCLVPPGVRLFRAAYAQDRLASVGAPLAGFPGGYLGAARLARSLGRLDAAALFAGAALDEALRALCRRQGVPDRDEGGAREIALLAQALEERGAISPGDAARIAALAAVADRIAGGDDHGIDEAVIARMIDEAEAIAQRAR